MTNQPNNSESINNRLDRIEATLADVADLTLAHDEVLLRLEETASQHDEALTRIESAIAQLTASTNQAINLATQAISMASENNLRIREILEYLYQERPNGRGNA